MVMIGFVFEREEGIGGNGKKLKSVRGFKKV